MNAKVKKGTPKKETLGFQTEVQQLLDLMIHSLYSNKEIFLRELISNASDALDRLRYQALQNDSLYEGDVDLRIRVEYNKENKTITVLDNGIGMSREDVIEQLGTIAKSGTRQFIESLTGDKSKDSQLIGQFGVGFYSAFIVAEKVEVISRRAGLARGKGVRWVSQGANDYTVESLSRAKRGTKVILRLREEAEEFLDGFRLRHIIKKYSDHISLPIVMPRENGKDGKASGNNGKVVTADETVNAATALWMRNKKDIKAGEYHEFYKHLTYDSEPPLAYVHSKVEGKLEYRSLLFIPSRAPFDLWDRRQQYGVKLYVRRIFIMDDTEQLVPAYLRFLRGVIDSDDLPLNVSRELLQKNKTIDAIRSGCAKKILDLLSKMADDDTEKYAKFWKEFGRVLKEGIIEATDRRKELTKLFRFASTLDDKEEQTVSLRDYVSRMPKDQAAIYYCIADSFAKAKHSPHLEIFREKKIEVLLLSDPIDDWLVSHLGEFEDKPLQSVAKGELDLGQLGADKDETTSKSHSEAADKLMARIKKVLDDKVKDVRVSSRLTDSPACLVADKNDLGRNMERLLKEAGREFSMSKPVLEINMAHPAVVKLSEATDKQFQDWAHILFDQALLSEGGQLEEPAEFVRRLNNMFMALDSTTKQN